MLTDLASKSAEAAGMKVSWLVANSAAQDFNRPGVAVTPWFTAGMYDAYKDAHATPPLWRRLMRRGMSAFGAEPHDSALKADPVKTLRADFLRAIELNPGHAIAYYWYAEYLMTVGRPEDAIARVKQSRQMDPLNSVLNSSVAIILYLARRYDQAQEELRKAWKSIQTTFYFISGWDWFTSSRSCSLTPSRRCRRRSRFPAGARRR